jgi:probable F420-dependent oxidoreductase
MQLGLSLPQLGAFGGREAVARVATHAEAIGFDSLWVADRLLLPHEPRDPYPGTPDLSWPDVFAACLDPLDTLSFAAAHTHGIALGTSVLNLPYYRTLAIARRLATLDVLSGGRLLVGAGLGWSRDEFDALGVSPHGLGRRLDDQLDAIEAIWHDDPVRFDGDGERIPLGAVGPKPLQRPRPPLYLAAFTEPGLRRIARRADGWLTAFLPLDAIVAMHGRIRDLATEAGRDPDRIDLLVRANLHVTSTRVTPDATPFVGTVEQIADDIARYADAGVDHLHIDLQYSEGIEGAAALLDTA